MMEIISLNQDKNRLNKFVESCADKILNILQL